MPNINNLKPFQKGQIANPNGRPKGSKNLATLVRELENEDFDWTNVPLKQKDAVAKIGSPMKAIVFRAMAMAANGNIQAMNFLRKSGYGDKLVVETEDGFFNTPKVQIEIITPNHATPSQDNTAQSSPANSMD